jgi:hypothetical protein
MHPVQNAEDQPNSADSTFTRALDQYALPISSALLCWGIYGSPGGILGAGLGLYINEECLKTEERDSHILYDELSSAPSPQQMA